MKSLFRTILFTTLSFAGSFTLVLGQSAGIGQWRDYLPYRLTTFSAVAGEKIYAATPYSLIVYDQTDKTIERLTTVNGLSDFGVSALAYQEDSETLIVGYDNGNIDLLQGNSIINMADVKRSNILSSKKINRIIHQGEDIYLACGFGIVVINIERLEVKDRYIIGNGGSFVSINDIAFNNGNIYAATSEGIYTAHLDDPNISIFSAWSLQPIEHPVQDFSSIFEYAGEVYANYDSPTFSSDSLFVLNNGSWQFSDKITGKGNASFTKKGDNLIVAQSNSISEYDQSWNTVNSVFTYGDGKRAPSANFCMLDDNGIYWIADRNQGLVKTPRDNQWASVILEPSGPRTAKAIDITISHDQLWVAPGGRNAQWSNLFFNDGIFSYIDNQWDYIHKENVEALEPVFDFVTVAVDPNNTNRVYGATIGSGLVEFTNREVSTIFDNTNSPLDTGNLDFKGWVAVTDVEFDASGNLWCTNSRTNDFLLAKTPGGEWYNYDFASASLATPVTGRILVTSFNHKWIEIPGEEFGIFAFDDNGTLSNTSDDRWVVLNQSAGSGGLPSNEVYAMAEDLDNEIWVGTNAGIAVFFSPESVFDGGSSADAQQILVTQDGYTGFLLETQTILTIAVDGADRKWVGTDGSGVFLLSPDGTEELLHFTTENSPLFSNNINDITIDPKTGEVFIATEEGILSYRGEATEANFEFEDVFAFPNPVRHAYEGPIAIKGLATNASVKITDISGNMVFETFAQGGQAVWNGRDFNGNRPSTGVYLVYAAKQDGLSSFVTKILFIN